MNKIASTLVSISLLLCTASAYAQSGAASDRGAAGDVSSKPNVSAKAKDASLNTGGYTGKASSSVSSPDSAFMKKAAIGGIAEVELGQLAQQKGASAQVKEFGARMVQDHSKANDELKQIAGGKGVTLPTALDSKNQKIVDRLQKLSGAAFDRAYMDDMVADHKKDVADFQKESKGGKDAEVKAFAAKTLPTLQEHLKMAQSASPAKTNGSKGSSAASGVTK